MGDAGVLKRSEFLYSDYTTAPNSKRDVREGMHATLSALAGKYRRGGSCLVVIRLSRC